MVSAAQGAPESQLTRGWEGILGSMQTNAGSIFVFLPEHLLAPVQGRMLGQAHFWAPCSHSYVHAGPLRQSSLHTARGVFAAWCRKRDLCRHQTRTISSHGQLWDLGKPVQSSWPAETSGGCVSEQNIWCHSALFPLSWPRSCCFFYSSRVAPKENTSSSACYAW